MGMIFFSTMGHAESSLRFEWNQVIAIIKDKETLFETMLNEGLKPSDSADFLIKLAVKPVRVGDSRSASNESDFRFLYLWGIIAPYAFNVIPELQEEFPLCYRYLIQDPKIVTISKKYLLSDIEPLAPEQRSKILAEAGLRREITSSNPPAA